jgi:hypothetical protein
VGTRTTGCVLEYESMKTCHGENCVVSSTEDSVYRESLSIVFGLSYRPFSKENREKPTKRSTATKSL